MMKNKRVRSVVVATSCAIVSVGIVLGAIELDKAQEANECLKQEIKAAEQEVEVVIKERDIKSDELEATENERKRLNDELWNELQQVEKLKQENETLQKKNNDLKQQISSRSSSSNTRTPNSNSRTVTESTSSSSGKGKLIGTFQATAYTSDPAENGGYSVTAMGTPLRVGVAAIDPSVVPLGSKLYIEYADGTPYGYVNAEDTGGAIKSSRIDLLVSSKSAARQFGRRDMRVYLVE